MSYLQRIKLFSLAGLGLIVSAFLGLLSNSGTPSINKNYKLNADPFFCERYPQYCETPFSINGLQTVSNMSSQEASSPPPKEDVLMDKVEVSWPRQMQKDNSYSIKVSLANRAGAVIVPPLEKEDHQPRVGTLDPIVPPDQLKQKTPGRDYSVYGTAILTMNNYKVDRASPMWLPLDKPKAEWQWRVTPLQTESQPFDINIEVAFRDNNGDILARGLKLGNSLEVGGEGKKLVGEPVFHDSYDVYVYGHWLTKDSFNIGSLLTGLVGAGLTIPFIYERYKEHQKRQKRKSTIPKRRQAQYKGAGRVLSGEGRKSDKKSLPAQPKDKRSGRT